MMNLPPPPKQSDQATKLNEQRMLTRNNKKVVLRSKDFEPMVLAKAEAYSRAYRLAHPARPEQKSRADKQAERKQGRLTQNTLNQRARKLAQKEKRKIEAQIALSRETIVREDLRDKQETDDINDAIYQESLIVHDAGDLFINDLEPGYRAQLKTKRQEKIKIEHLKKEKFEAHCEIKQLAKEKFEAQMEESKGTDLLTQDGLKTKDVLMPLPSWEPLLTGSIRTTKFLSTGHRMRRVRTYRATCNKTRSKEVVLLVDDGDKSYIKFRSKGILANSKRTNPSTLTYDQPEVFEEQMLQGAKSVYGSFSRTMSNLTDIVDKTKDLLRTGEGANEIGAIQKAIEQTTITAKKIETTMTKADAQIEQLGTTQVNVQKASSQVEALAQQTQSMLNNVRDFISGTAGSDSVHRIMRYLVYAFGAVLFMYTSYYLCRLGMYVLLDNLSFVVWQSFKPSEAVRNLFRKDSPSNNNNSEERFNSQVGDETDAEGVYQSLITLLANSFSTSTSKQVMADSFRLKRVQTYHKAFVISKDIGNFLQKFCGAFINDAAEMIFDHPLFAGEQKELYKQALEQYEKTLICNQEYQTDFISNKRMPEWRKAVHALYEKNNHLKTRIMREEMYSTKLSDYFRSVELNMKVYQAVCDYETKDIKRQRPLCIQLDGVPGTGKSSIIPFIVKTLYYKAYPNNPFTDSVMYHRQPGNEFWDAYDQNFAVIFDDFLQSSATEDTKRVALELIAAINDASYPLHMADLNEKGKMYFTSELVVLTSNRTGKVPANMGISDNRAFIRRRDVVAVFKTEFHPNENFDINKVRLDIVDPTEKVDKPLKENISFKDFLIYLTNLFGKMRKQRAEITTALENFSPEEFLGPEVFGSQMEEIPLRDMARTRRAVGSGLTPPPVMDLRKRQEKPSNSNIQVTIVNDNLKKRVRKQEDKKEKLDNELHAYDQTSAIDELMKIPVEKETSDESLFETPVEDISPINDEKDESEYETPLVPPILQSEKDQKSWRGFLPKLRKDFYPIQNGQVILPVWNQVVSNEATALFVKNFVKEINSTYGWDTSPFKHPIVEISDRNLLDLILTVVNDIYFDKVSERYPADVQEKHRQKISKMNPYYLLEGEAYYVRYNYIHFAILDDKFEDVWTWHSLAKKKPLPNYPFIHDVKFRLSYLPDTIRGAKTWFSSKYSSMFTRNTDATENKAVSNEHKKLISYSERLKDFWTSNAYRIVGGVVIFLPMFFMALNTIICNAFSSDEEHSGGMKSDLYNGGKKQNKHMQNVANKGVHNPNLKVVKLDPKKTPVEAHGEWDKSMESVVKKTHKNIGHIFQGTRTQCCTFVNKNQFLSTRHFMTSLEKGTFTIEIGDKKYELSTDDILVRTFEDQDVAGVTVLRGLEKMPHPAVIKDHFLKDDEKYRAFTGGAVMVGPNGIETRAANVMNIHTVAYPQHISPGYETTVSVFDVFAVTTVTQRGDCSKLYFGNNTSLTHKILGIHTAGSQYRGVGTFVTQEKLEMLFPREEIESQMFESPIPLMGFFENKPSFDTEFFEKCPTIQEVGIVEPKYAVSFPNETVKIETIFNPMDDTVECLPTRLRQVKRDGVSISPMACGLEKKYACLKPNRPFPADLDIVAEIFADKIPKLVTPRTYDLEEALNYPKDNKFMKPPESTTSRGYDKLSGLKQDPQNLARGKQACMNFNPVDEKYELTPEFKPIMDDLISKFPVQPKNYPHVIVDCVKDELLPIAKHFELVEKLGGLFVRNWHFKYRIMGSQPFGYFLLEKMYMGAFYSNMLAWRQQGGPCDIGNNPYSADWSDMINDMMFFGKDTVFLAGDFKSFDASIRKKMISTCTKIIQKWYDYPENSHERKCIDELQRILGEDVLHLAGNILYRTSGNPSGRLYTTVLNSMVVVLTFMLTAYRKEGAQGALYVLEHIRTLGDDHILPMHKDNCWMTMKDVAAVATELGMEYTAVFKDEALPDFYAPDKVKYLQRKFLYREDLGMHVGAFSKEDIEQLPYWGSKKLGDHDRAYFAACCTLREAFLHGRTYFNDMKTKLNKKLHEHNFRPVTLIYEELLNGYLGHTTFDFTQFKSPYSGEVFQSQMDRKERLPANDTPTQREQLTTFTDLVEYTDASQSRPLVSAVSSRTNPYEDQGLGKILSRVDNISTFNWVSTQTAGTKIAEFEFPGDHLPPNIIDKLNGFSYFRAAVKLSFRLNTTQFNAGQLMVSYLPCNSFLYADTKNRSFSSIYTASMLEHVLISANTQESISITIPFVCPMNWWNLNYASSELPGLFGQVFVYVVAPLTDALNVTTITVPVQVFCNYVFPEVTGFDIGNVTLPGERFEKQSDDLLIVDKPKTGREVMDGQANQKKESALKSDLGIMSDIGMAVARTSYRIGNIPIPIVSGIMDSIGDLFYDASSKAMSMGLSYPFNNSQQTTVTPNISQNTAYAHGLFNGFKLSLDPDNMVSNKTNLYCTDRDFTKFDQYWRIPGLIAIGSITGSDTANEVLFAQSVSPLLCYNQDLTTGRMYQPTPLGAVARNFKWWRGSIQFKINFITNMCISSRVALIWDPWAIDNTAVPDNRRGDVITKIVNINGDTTAEITIPYLHEKAWSPRGTFEGANSIPSPTAFATNGCLKIQLLTTPTATQVSTAVIDFQVWMSAGVGFEVAQPQDPMSNELAELPELKFITTDEKFTAQSGDMNDMRASFKNSFPSIVPAHEVTSGGIQMGETINSWTTLFKRSTFIKNITVPAYGAGGVLVDAMPPDDPTMNPFYTLLNQFLFWRGSFRFIFRITSSTPVMFSIMLTNNITQSSRAYGLNGMLFWDTALRNQFEVELPFYTQLNFYTPDLRTLFHYDTPAIYVQSYSPGSTAVTIPVCVALGDDFSIGYPLAPQPLFIVDPGRKSKNVSPNDNDEKPSFALARKQQPKSKRS
jgi:hypothetical protein